MSSFKQNLTILTSWRECGEDALTVSIPKHILRDDRRIAAAWSAAKAVRIPPNAPQFLEAAIREVATPLLRAQDEDIFDAKADWPVPKEQLFRRTLCTHSALSARMEVTVCEQIASIPTLVGDDIVRLLEHVGGDIESSLNREVVLVIQIVVTGAVCRAFQNTTF